MRAAFYTIILLFQFIRITVPLPPPPDHPSRRILILPLDPFHEKAPQTPSPTELLLLLLLLFVNNARVFANVT